MSRGFTDYQWMRLAAGQLVALDPPSPRFPTPAGAYRWAASQDGAATWTLCSGTYRPLSPIIHGTPGGYRKELRRGLPPCEECTPAFVAYKDGLAARRAER